MGRFDGIGFSVADPKVKKLVDHGARPARIKRVAFGLQSGTDMMRSAHIHVTSKCESLQHGPVSGKLV